MALAPQTRAILARDLKIAFRSGGGWFYALLFYAVFAVLAGLAFGPELTALKRAAPGVIWLAAAIAVQFSVADVFNGDIRDGFLHAFAAEEESLFPYILAKFVFVMATVAAPLILAAPVVLVMYGVDFGMAIGAALILLTGLPGVILLSLFTAGLAAGLRAGGMLAMVVSAPVIMPILIFGVLAAKKFLMSGVFWSPETFVLAALTLLLGALTPPFMILVLRAALE